MDRSEFIRQLVLCEISDDYENLDQIIFPNVGHTTAKCGLTVERSEIVSALAGLVRDGLAKTYILSSKEPFTTELQDMPPLDVVDESFSIFFYITKAGRTTLGTQGEWWPFDHEDNLRPDWHLDSP